MTINIKQMNQQLKELTGPVLTIYLNIDPTSEEWKIRLKNGLKKTKQYIQASQPEQKQQYANIQQKVMSAITDEQRNIKQGLICFATSDELLIKHTQISITNAFHWDEYPVTEQWEQLLKQYPKSGVILLQRDQISILDTILGGLEQEAHYTFDLENKHWKQYKGIASGAIISSSANHRDQYDQRLKENQSRWFKSIVPTIQKHAKSSEWEGVYLVGPTELTNEMEQLLHTPILGIINRNFGGKTTHQVIQRVFKTNEYSKSRNQ